MQVHHAQPGSWPSYVIPLIVIAVVMVLRIRRMSRAQPLRLERLWLVPALYFVIVVALFVQAPPPGAGGWASAAVALIAGGFLGWQRGKMMRIQIDPDTHALSQRSSAAGVVFLVALLAVRYAVRDLGGTMHLNVALMTDTLAALALGMFGVQRLEMFIRARRMIAAMPPRQAGRQ